MIKCSSIKNPARKMCLLCAVFLVVALTSCNIFPKEIENCSIYLNKAISYDGGTNYNIVDGNYIVFEYYHNVPKQPFITDTGSTEIFVFQSEMGVQAFTLADADLEKHKSLYEFQAFSPYSGVYSVSKGTITGSQINTKVWNIEINTEIEFKDANGYPAPETKEFYIKKLFRTKD